MKKRIDLLRKVMLPFVLMFTLVVSGLSFSMDVSADDCVALDNFTYSLTDINGNIASTKNTSAGMKLIIFGRNTCGNTQHTMAAISGSDWVSGGQIEVMFIEVTGATEDEVKEFAKKYCCDDITVCATSNNVGSDIMWEYNHICGGSGFVTFPMICYVDSKNKIRGMMTGTREADEILRACNEFEELDIDDPALADPITATVTVRFGQTTARSMLDEMNARRTGSNGTVPWCWDSTNTEKVSCSGLQELIYDYDLEKVAMQRAAEIAVSYAHSRPDGTSCFTAYSEIGSFGSSSGENIAAGQTSSEQVLDGWWEENEKYEGQGHRRNILDSGFRYVGIGHVKVNGVDFWTQEFSSGSSSTTETAAMNSKANVDIRIYPGDIYDRISASVSRIPVAKGGSKTLPEVTEEIQHKGAAWGNYTPVVNSNEWVSADPEIAAISNGSITGKALGTTTISRKASYGNGTVSIDVTVTDGAVDEPEDPAIPLVDGVYNIPLKVTYGQNDARALFEELNARRTGAVGTPWCWNDSATEKVDYSGREALTYDYALEQVAMQRAAEVSIFYLNARQPSHTRPNDDHTETAFEEVAGAGSPVFELFLTGDESVEEMIDEWWEENETTYDEQFERRVILKQNARYAGIGHAVRDGHHFWVLELASTGGTADPIMAYEGEKTVNIQITPGNLSGHYISTSVDSIDLTVGESAPVPDIKEYVDTQMNFGEAIPIENNSAWKIADTSIADFSGGKIVAKAAGSTVLTRKRALLYWEGDAEIPITVREAGQGDDPGDTPGGGGQDDPGDTPGGGGQDDPGDTPGGGGQDDPGDTPGGGGQDDPGDTPGGGEDPYDPYDDWGDWDADISNGDIYLGYSVCTYNGKLRKPEVEVRDGDGYLLDEGLDYTVTYKNNKYVGTATVVVTGTGDYNGTLEKTFTIRPAATTLKSVKAAKKGFTAKWTKKTTQTKGYQLQYSTSSKFPTGSKTKMVTITKNKTVSKKVTKLKSKKKYYVRVRTYKTVNGKKYYSVWSKPKNVKTK